jgi:hypothetical protein
MDGESNSIRQMVGYIEDVIFRLSGSFNDINKLLVVEKYVLKIQADIGVESTFHKIIQKPFADARGFLKDFTENIAKLPHLFNGSVNLPDRAKISIPKAYLDRLVKDEIATNLTKYADTTGDNKIKVSFKMHENQLEISIINKVIVNQLNSSTGEGIKCLGLLSDCPLFAFNYRGKLRSSEFNQTLTFTLH